MDGLSEMSAAELQELLAKLQDDMEELQEERMFVLGQTGMHISAKKVSKYESDVANLEAKIAEVEEAIRARS